LTTIRLALANARFPSTADESVALAEDLILQAGDRGANIVCFPECFIPGYSGIGKVIPPPNATFLKHAAQVISRAAATANIAVIMGTERLAEQSLIATALVINADGSVQGYQDKVQIDPREEGTYTPGTERRIFHTGSLTFGIVICHEGWRYPETVRWAVRRGAQIVFHPHFHETQPGSYRPTSFAEPANTFHEKAVLCRAAENTCYIATVNFASRGSPTTSAIVNPDGTLLTYQPYGVEGLLIADVDLDAATRQLAERLRPTL